MTEPKKQGKLSVQRPEGYIYIGAGKRLNTVYPRASQRAATIFSLALEVRDFLVARFVPDTGYVSGPVLAIEVKPAHSKGLSPAQKQMARLLAHVGIVVQVERAACLKRTCRACKKGALDG